MARRNAIERLPNVEPNPWHRCFFLLHIFIFVVSVVCFVAVKGVWFASATTAGIAVALLLAGGMPDGWLVAFTNRPQPHHRRWLAMAFWPGWLQGNQSSRAQWWADRTKPLFR